MDERSLYARIVKLKRYCGFRRRGEGWQRGALVMSDSTLTSMDEPTWTSSLTRWRQQ